jgi:hypothetical protein
MSKSLSRLLAAMTCAASLSVYATDDSDSRRPLQGKHHAPPQAAVDACKGLAEKDSCQFSRRDHETVAGRCSLPPRGADATTLSCRPNHKPKDSGATTPPK